MDERKSSGILRLIKVYFYKGVMDMKVLCKDDTGTARKRLTIDKEYEVIDISPHFQYKIKEDNCDETWWNRERFI